MAFGQIKWRDCHLRYKINSEIFGEFKNSLYVCNVNQNTKIMKRSGAIIITFYLIVLGYFLIYRPWVIAEVIVALGITLIIVSFIRDIVMKFKFKKL
jgi:hypothetical protein